MQEERGLNMQTGTATGPAEVVAGVLDAIRGGDIEAIATLVHDDVVWDVVGADYMPHGNRFEGRDAVLNDFLIGTVLPAWDLTRPITIDVVGLHVDGPVAVAEWTVDATSARGRDYHNDYCVVFTVDAGRIRSVREFLNTEYAKRVLFD
jgi:ketosteroid isomerase-like protein